MTMRSSGTSESSPLPAFVALRRISQADRRDHLVFLPSYQPADEYEGRHRWDPAATWTEKEEKSVIRKIDLRIMTFACCE